MAGNAEGIYVAIGIAIALGVAIFVLNIINTINYSASASTANNLMKQYGTPSISQLTSPQSAIAANIATLGNGITLNFVGPTSWISASNPLTVTITGAYPANVATNVIVANGMTSVTNTFTVTSGSNGELLCSYCGNFLTINTITLTGVPASAAPSLNVQAVEVFNSVTPSSAPASYTSNQISANGIATVTLPNTYGIVVNATASSGSLNSAYTNNLVILVGALVLIALLVAILLALRSGGFGTGGSGGFMK